MKKSFFPSFNFAYFKIKTAKLCKYVIFGCKHTDYPYPPSLSTLFFKQQSQLRGLQYFCCWYESHGSQIFPASWTSFSAWYNWTD